MSNKNYYQKFGILDEPKKYFIEVKPVPVKRRVKVKVKKPWSSDRLIKK